MTVVHVVEVDGEVLAFVSAAGPPSLDALTEAELAVAKLAANGLTNLEIARARETSVATVVNQLGAVYRKLDLDGRRILAARLAGRVSAKER